MIIVKEKSLQENLFGGKEGKAAVAFIMPLLGSDTGFTARGKYLVHIRSNKTGSEAVVSNLTAVDNRGAYLVFTGSVNYVTIRIKDIVNANENNGVIVVGAQGGDVIYTIRQE